MKLNTTLGGAAAAACALGLALPAATEAKAPKNPTSIQLSFLGRYQTGVFGDAAAEFVAHDEKSQRLFVVNGAALAIDVLDIANPAATALSFSIDVSGLGRPTHVAVARGIVAVAVIAPIATNPGVAALYDIDGNPLLTIPVGATPAWVEFTRNGKTLLVSNEGEPDTDYIVDPEGSVTVIDLKGGKEPEVESVRTADFQSFNGMPLDPSVRIFGPGASVAEDLEPQSIAVADDGKTAWVTLQENNAMAILDVRSATIADVVGLGFKDHLLPGNALDPSDRDSAIKIQNWPLLGMFQPEGIAAFRAPAPPSGASSRPGQPATFLVTANEGEVREYRALLEEKRISTLALDPVAFPNAATLKAVANIGRLSATALLGDVDSDGDYDKLYTFGARSISIWGADGQRVWDSGDLIEQTFAAFQPANFNCTDNANDFDSRSDNKGPEPEGITVGKIGGHTYAFASLERAGGVFVMDISDVSAPAFVEYVTTRDFLGSPPAGTAGDLGPKGLLFIDAKASPTRRPLLVVAHEVSGSTAIFQIDPVY